MKEISYSLITDALVVDQAAKIKPRCDLTQLGIGIMVEELATDETRLDRRTSVCNSFGIFEAGDAIVVMRFEMQSL